MKIPKINKIHVMDHHDKLYSSCVCWQRIRPINMFTFELAVNGRLIFNGPHILGASDAEIYDYSVPYNVCTLYIYNIELSHINV